MTWKWATAVELDNPPLYCARVAAFLVPSGRAKKRRAAVAAELLAFVASAGRPITLRDRDIAARAGCHRNTVVRAHQAPRLRFILRRRRRFDPATRRAFPSVRSLRALFGPILDLYLWKRACRAAAVAHARRGRRRVGAESGDSYLELALLSPWSPAFSFRASLLVPS